MTTGNSTPVSLQEFIDLLDVYGANQQRWPSHQRIAAVELLRRDGDARRLLAEAVALDRALQMARVPPAHSNHDLVDQIVSAAGMEGCAPGASSGAAAQKEDRAAANSNVIAWPGARRRGAGSILEASKAANAGVSQGNAPRPMRQAGRSAAFLAASLVLGIYIGMNNGGATVFQALAAAAGMSASYEAEVSALDLGDVSGLDGEAL